MKINYSDIQEKFNQVIEYSQHYEGINSDDLFLRWSEAKSSFIKLMKGELIYEYPREVTFELGEKDKDNKINNFISRIEENWCIEELARFLEIQRKGFYSNRVINDYDYEGQIIPKGMKLIKSFSYFIKDKQILEEIQMAASMIIQENKITGKLCFSVHPLDFLSLSENSHNWRSCHALDGDYRAGNLSYMVDKTTAICYIKSNREEELNNFPFKWNSKKWRVLLYFSNNWEMMFAGRQYPFSSESGLEFVKDELLPMIVPSCYWTDWLSKKITSSTEKGITFNFKEKYVPVGNCLIPLKTLVKNEDGSLQFNDILSSSCYDPKYSYRCRNYNNDFIPIIYPSSSERYQTYFKVGGKIKCLKCNEDYISSSETMLCDECNQIYGQCDDSYATCDCCGGTYYREDGVYCQSIEDYICYSCAEHCCGTCDICGELYYDIDLKHHEETGHWCCPYCYDDLIVNEEE